MKENQSITDFKAQVTYDLNTVPGKSLLFAPTFDVIVMKN